MEKCSKKFKLILKQKSLLNSFSLKIAKSEARTLIQASRFSFKLE